MSHRMAEKMQKGDAKDYFLRNYWFESYSEIADATGWSKSTLQRWKRENNLPKKNERNRVKYTHGVSIERVLFHLHHHAKMSTPEMAEALNVHRPQLKKWFDSTDVRKRGRSEAEQVKWEKLSESERQEKVDSMSDGFKEQMKGCGYALFRTNYNGYESWRSKDPDGVERGMKVHRLLAVAEYGIEAVKGKVVHHKNGLRWDNRPENIQPMDETDHLQEHYDEREIGEDGQFK